MLIKQKQVKELTDISEKVQVTNNLNFSNEEKIKEIISKISEIKKKLKKE